ncbi:MAG: hypothetical protein J6X60_04090, partial [Ruminiclostridium sp.]|nr:hypothetical protein [Ruminiclostridium sp.]
IYGTSDIGSFYVACVKGDYFDYFVINDNCFPMNSALDKICRKIAGTCKTTAVSIPDRMLSYTVKFSEPKTDSEYISTARALVGKWLDSLKKESAEYKLTSYTFNDKSLPTERNIVRGTGLISGGREFCCSVGFDVKGINQGSVFAQPEDSGYNKFYNYYSGPMVVVRCRWENGVCRIVDYGSGGDNLIKALNGISAKKTTYDTLFDFYRDTKQVEKLNKACTYNKTGNQSNSATSPIYMADGRIGYVAIYPRTYAATDKNGIKAAVYDNAFFDEKYVCTYSSPVDYVDYEGAQKENFHEKFSLVFDDYNGDGCADYALKQSAGKETADGAAYEVRCMSNDLTPRADRFSFFMAGRHEESIRLQHTDNGGYVYWSKGTDGKLYPNVTVDDYRMYSERYYLPAQYRIYDDEKTIYCFFWNNTEKDVKVGGKYHIEYNKNGEWVSVTANKTLSSKTAKAYYDTELKFDISDVKKNAGEYRVVMKVNGKTVYGGFYIGSRNASLSVSSAEKTIPQGKGTVSFTVKNTGTEPIRLTNAYISDGSKKIADIALNDSLLLAGDSKRIIADIDRTLAAGKYSIKIPVGKKNASIGFTVKKIKDSALTYFGGKCTVTDTDGKLTLTVKNNKYIKDTIVLYSTDIGTPEAFIKNRWQKTGLQFQGKTNMELYDRTIEIAYGKSASFTFTDLYRIIMDDPEMLDQARKLYDYFKEEMKKKDNNLPKELDKYRNVGFEEFVRLFANNGEETVAPPENSLYRVSIGGEYVYFIK